MTDPRLIAVDGPFCTTHKKVHRFDPSTPYQQWDTHTRFHGDEAACMEILMLAAPQTFPDTMTLRMGDSGLHPESGKDGWCYLEEGIVCVGRLGGLVDEHRDFKRADPRAFAKINCALKGARLARVENDPGLQEILKYTLRSDRTSHRGPFDIDVLMKEWWRMGLEAPVIRAMYRVIFGAWYHVFSGNAPVAKPTGTFRNALARWMVKRFAATPDIAKLVERLRTGKQVADKFDLWDDRGMQQTFNLDLRRNGKLEFDLEGTWECLWAAGTPEAVIEDILEKSFDAKYREQCGFAAAEDEFRSKAQYLTGGKNPYRVATIRSDSDYINRAAHHQDPTLDVLVMYLSSGHVRIFDLHKRLPIDPVAARIRESEMSKVHGRQRLPWARLEEKGTIVEALSWYNSHDGLGVFNSTETSPGTPITSVGRKQIERDVDNGLAFAHNRFRVMPAVEHVRLKERALERKRVAKAAAQSA